MAEDAAGPGANAEAELPRAAVKRVVKSKLDSLASEGAKDAKTPGKGMTLTSDALLAFSESARVFISYISSTANDLAKEGKRQTMSAEDVFKALEELEFPEYVAPLREALEAHKKAAKEKSEKKKADASARKRKEAPARDQDKEGGEKGEEEEGGAKEGAEAGEKAQQAKKEAKKSEKGKEKEEEEADGESEGGEGEGGQEEMDVDGKDA